MTETPPEGDGGTITETPPETPEPQDESLGAAPETETAPELKSSSNLTVTKVMKAATLPTPAGGTGGPIATVYGTRAEPVWTTKGWAAGAVSDKPNISSVEVKGETESLTNADLAGAVAEIVKNDKALDTWEPKGWVPGGGAPATGATAGTPGSFTPAGSTPPASVAALQGGSIVANPATAWTTGQYVQTGTAGAPGEACWSGSGWVGGKAP